MTNLKISPFLTLDRPEINKSKFADWCLGQFCSLYLFWCVIHKYYITQMMKTGQWYNYLMIYDVHKPFSYDKTYPMSHKLKLYEHFEKITTFRIHNNCHKILIYLISALSDIFLSNLPTTSFTMKTLSFANMNFFDTYWHLTYLQNRIQNLTRLDLSIK